MFHSGKNINVHSLTLNVHLRMITCWLLTVDMLCLESPYTFSLALIVFVSSFLPFKVGERKEKEGDTLTTRVTNGRRRRFVFRQSHVCNDAYNTVNM